MPKITAIRAGKVFLLLLMICYLLSQTQAQSQEPAPQLSVVQKVPSDGSWLNNDTKFFFKGTQLALRLSDAQPGDTLSCIIDHHPSLNPNRSPYTQQDTLLSSISVVTSDGESDSQSPYQTVTVLEDQNEAILPFGTTNIGTFYIECLEINAQMGTPIYKFTINMISSCYFLPSGTELPEQNCGPNGYCDEPSDQCHCNEMYRLTTVVDEQIGSNACIALAPVEIIYKYKYISPTGGMSITQNQENPGEFQILPVNTPAHISSSSILRIEARVVVGQTTPTMLTITSNHDDTLSYNLQIDSDSRTGYYEIPMALSFHDQPLIFTLMAIDDEWFPGPFNSPPIYTYGQCHSPPSSKLSTTPWKRSCGRGYCVDTTQICKCDLGWTGRGCEFRPVLPSFTLGDSTRSGFPAKGTFDLTSGDPLKLIFEQQPNGTPRGMILFTVHDEPGPFPDSLFARTFPSDDISSIEFPINGSYTVRLGWEVIFFEGPIEPRHSGVFDVNIVSPCLSITNNLESMCAENSYCSPDTLKCECNHNYYKKEGSGESEQGGTDVICIHYETPKISYSYTTNTFNSTSDWTNTELSTISHGYVGTQIIVRIEETVNAPDHGSLWLLVEEDLDTDLPPPAFLPVFPVLPRTSPQLLNQLSTKGSILHTLQQNSQRNLTATRPLMKKKEPIPPTIIKIDLTGDTISQYIELPTLGSYILHPTFYIDDFPDVNIRTKPPSSPQVKIVSQCFNIDMESQTFRDACPFDQSCRSSGRCTFNASYLNSLFLSLIITIITLLINVVIH